LEDHVVKRRPTQTQRIGDRTLEIAALLGREFALPLVQGAAGSEEGIESLFERGILEEGSQSGQGRFAKSAEVKRVAAGVPWSRRRQHYLSLGEAAQQLRYPPEDIAPFFERAQQLETAREWWVRAARRACDSGGYPRALVWLDRAIAIWPWNESPEERVRVLRELARCAMNGGKTEPARRAWDELAEYAADSGSASLHVEALRQLAGLASDAARISDYLRRGAEVAERQLAPEEAVRQILIYVDNLACRVRVAAAVKELDRAVRIAEDTGDSALLSEVRGWQGLVSAMSGEHARAKELVEESLRLAVENDLTEQAALAYRRRANIQDYGGQYAEEKRAQVAAIEFCRASKAGGEMVCLGCLAYACLRTGDWQEAIRSARAVDRDERAAPALKAISACVRGLVQAFRGERGPATRHLDAAARHFRIEGLVGMEFFALWGFAYLRHADGDTAGALDVCDQARALWRETDDAHDIVPMLLFAGGMYADAGKRDRLADCLDILGEVLRRNPLGEARAALTALQAEQARLEGSPTDAHTGLVEAASRYTALGLPVERLWVAGRGAVHGTGDSSDASMNEAVALAKRLGMRPMLQLLQSGSDTSRLDCDLTRRQREVLRSLAAGLTSKEIADRLGLSTRTVEMHVGRLLQRLNCRTRPEAIRSAIERGWLQPDSAEPI
jgi:DNA-binding CsgD family transcriptional regulator/tetratricopeptide (TPR) repeat protein